MPDGSLILFTRSNDDLTSADVNGSPFENLTPFLSLHVHAVCVAFALQPVASDGVGPSLPERVVEQVLVDEECRR